MTKTDPKFLRGFWLKVGSFALGGLIVVSAVIASDYRLGFDLQTLSGEPKCLDHTLYLITKGQPGAVKRGDLVEALMPWTGMPVGAPPGFKLVKRIAAVHGDRIRVRGTELYINDSFVDRLWLAKSIPGKKIGDFDREIILAADEVFLIGTTKESFDSRYWGPVKHEALIGRARPLL